MVGIVVPLETLEPIHQLCDISEHSVDPASRTSASGNCNAHRKPVQLILGPINLRTKQNSKVFIFILCKIGSTLVDGSVPPGTMVQASMILKPFVRDKTLSPLEGLTSFNNRACSFDVESQYHIRQSLNSINTLIQQ